MLGEVVGGVGVVRVSAWNVPSVLNAMLPVASGALGVVEVLVGGFNSESGTFTA